MDVEIKHNKSDLAGQAGIFVARKRYSDGPRPLQIMTQFTFNERASGASIYARLPAQFKKNVKEPTTNVVGLSQRFSMLDQPGAPPGNVHIFKGRKFEPKPSDDLWRRLSVIVSPAGVRAFWDDQPAGFVSAAEIVAHARPRFDALGDPTGPSFTVPNRGGLGLILSTGAASFRRIIVTPNPSFPPL